MLLFLSLQLSSLGCILLCFHGNDFLSWQGM
uniref:Uncharacterized protein n=1 Tax=Rhizophora mucronata TaxID=61149 RepID=A0A2P2P020_RHIMU